MKRLKVLLLLSSGHAVSHWYIGVTMLILPLIREDFSLSFTEVGLIIAIRSLAGAVGNGASGIVVDIIGKRHLVLTLSVAGIGIFWFFIGHAHTFALLLLLFPLAALFGSFWHAPSMSLLSETFPDRKGLALGVHGAVANLGQSVAPLAVAFLITYAGWRWTIKAHVAPGVLFALLLIIFLPRLGNFDSEKKTGAVFWEMVKNKILKNRALLFISIISALRTMGQRGIETYLALFFVEKFGFSPIWLGFYLSILTFAATFPEPLIGWLSDHIGRKGILGISLTLSGLSVIAITAAPGGVPLMAAVGSLGFFHFSLRPIIFAFALDATPPEIGATVVSYVFTWNHAVSALAPLIGGFLADAFGIHFALYFVALLSFIAALFAVSVRLQR